MKSIFSLIISAALVVSGYSQTRNVLVGTNNSVVQPTNFWSADASNARIGLGLGTAATNPASAFQPSSATLSNLASSNAVNLTNLRATNLVGVIPSSNIPSTTLTNISGTLSIASGGTGATNASNARVNLGATTVGNNLFTATNAEAARTAIGALVTNGNAIALTNFPIIALASNVTGTIDISNGGTGATNAGEARTNLGATSVGGSLFTATNVTHARNILGMGGDGLNSSIGGGLSNIASASGSTVSGGSFNSASESWATVSGGNNNSATNFYSVVSGGSANVAGGLNSMVAGGISSEAIGNYSFAAGRRAKATNTGAFVWADSQNENFSSTNSDSFNVRAYGGMSLDLGTNGISFRNATNAAISRTNLGLGLPALTNTNNSNFLAAFFGANTNPVLVNTNGEVVSPTNFWQAAPISTTVQYQTNVTATSTNAATNSRNLFLFSLAPSVSGVTNTVTLPTNPATTFEGDRATIIHLATNSANTVTAIRQLGAATNLITLNQVDEAVLLMYRGGQWGLADNLSFIEPIYFSGTNALVNAAASRTNLGLGNISTNTAYTTQTAVYINTNLFATNGQAVFTNLGTSFLEFRTLFVVGTNTNAIVFEEPAQRTNFLHSLGLGPTNSVIFSSATIGGDTYIDSAGILWGGIDRIQLEEMKLQGGSWQVDGGSFSVSGSFDVAGETNKAITRTNLGLGLPALTNTSNTAFQAAVFTTNTAPTNSGNSNAINFNTAVKWMEISIVTNNVTNSYRIPLFQ